MRRANTLSLELDDVVEDIVLKPRIKPKCQSPQNGTPSWFRKNPSALPSFFDKKVSRVSPTVSRDNSPTRSLSPSNDRLSPSDKSGRYSSSRYDQSTTTILETTPKSNLERARRDSYRRSLSAGQCTNSSPIQNKREQPSRDKHGEVLPFASSTRKRALKPPVLTLPGALSGLPADLPTDQDEDNFVDSDIYQDCSMSAVDPVPPPRRTPPLLKERKKKQNEISSVAEDNPIIIPNSTKQVINQTSLETTSTARQSPVSPLAPTTSNNVAALVQYSKQLAKLSAIDPNVIISDPSAYDRHAVEFARTTLHSPIQTNPDTLRMSEFIVRTHLNRYHPSQGERDEVDGSLPDRDADMSRVVSGLEEVGRGGGEQGQRKSGALTSRDQRMEDTPIVRVIKRPASAAAGPVRAISPTSPSTFSAPLQIKTAVGKASSSSVAAWNDDSHRERQCEKDTERLHPSDTTEEDHMDTNRLSPIVSSMNETLKSSSPLPLLSLETPTQRPLFARGGGAPLQRLGSGSSDLDSEPTCEQSEIPHHYRTSFVRRLPGHRGGSKKNLLAAESQCSSPDEIQRRLREMGSEMVYSYEADFLEDLDLT
jgi:hypothetical protein